jgi:hypothetical protein
MWLLLLLWTVHFGFLEKLNLHLDIQRQSWALGKKYKIQFLSGIFGVVSFPYILPHQLCTVHELGYRVVY